MDLVGPRHMQSGIAVWKCLLRVHQACFLCIELHLTCCFPFPSVLACLPSFPGHQEQKRVDGTTREVKKVRKARNRRQEWNMMAYDKELRPDHRVSQRVHHGASSEGSLSPDTRCVHVMDPLPMFEPCALGFCVPHFVLENDIYILLSKQCLMAALFQVGWLCMLFQLS